ncbi:MAG: hypothetical protein ACYCX2_04625 [Christensenellales bacterium]
MTRQKDKKNSVLLCWIVFLAVAAIGAFMFLQQKDVVAELSAIDIAPKEPDTSGSGAWRNTSGQTGVSLEYSKNGSLSENEYITPHGFLIKSYSDVWAGEKLKEIYNEILNNGHGAELQYINSVIVYPQKREYEDSSIRGSQRSQREEFGIYFDFSAIVPRELTYSVVSSTSDITLYDMDSYQTIEEAADTISHEYGHHFTRYYFFEDESKIMSSEYYRIRGLGAYPQAREYEDYDEYMENYEWSIMEMAAEDYVQVLGSKNAKRTEDYKDIKEALSYYLKTKKEYKAGTEDYYNAFPQTNVFIPLAAQVEGLEGYFHSFLKDDFFERPAVDPQISITFARRSSHGYVYYDVSWNEIPEGALYTLVCYDRDGKIFRPVKTVEGGDNQAAVVGTASDIKGNYLHYWTDRITDEDRNFKVYVLLYNGRIVSSELIPKSF